MKRVLYTGGALKQLKAYGNVRARVMGAIMEYAADQTAHANQVKSLVGLNAKRLRVGDFRVIFEETETQITVTKLALAAMFTNRNEMMDTITLTAEAYQELIDARDHAITMRDVASGTMPVLTQEQAIEYLDAASPLAFWRKHRGHSQAALAGILNISQPYLAQIESGKRVGDVNLYAKIAKALQVRIDDLVA